MQSTANVMQMILTNSSTTNQISEHKDPQTQSYVHCCYKYIKIIFGDRKQGKFNTLEPQTVKYSLDSMDPSAAWRSWTMLSIIYWNDELT